MRKRSGALSFMKVSMVSRRFWPHFRRTEKKAGFPKQYRDHVFVKIARARLQVVNMKSSSLVTLLAARMRSRYSTTLPAATGLPNFFLRRTRRTMNLRPRMGEGSGEWGEPSPR
jgi:hypothetical protein